MKRSWWTGWAPRTSGATSPSTRRPTSSRRRNWTRSSTATRRWRWCSTSAPSARPRATDGDLTWATNVELSRRIWHWCAAREVRFVYASSAATYGDGAARVRRRPQPGRAGEAAAAQPVWLDQARLRPARGARAGRRRGTAAAMGRAEILQRLWPERIPQGLDDLGGEGQARRGRRRRSGEAVPLRPSPACRTASRSATSSGSATWST